MFAIRLRVNERMPMTPGKLAATFRAAAPAEFDAVSDALLEAALEERLLAGRTAWPSLSVAEHDFAVYLAERSPLGVLPALAHAGDLLLACACGAGDHDARAAFHRTYDSVVSRVLRRRGAGAASLEDVHQSVFEKLLVATEGTRPKVADYRGVGPLKAWVATVAVTTLLMSRRSNERRREQSASEDSVVESVLEAGPELRLLKKHYREPVESAIRYALGKLGDRERVLLRLHVCERMSIDRLGTMYGVNRATAARWLAKARDSLLSITREEIRRGLGVSNRECDSILNLVQSQLDVSVARHLGG
jgi:RNA polymerase sigma-70 factor (ECF subfamily)